MRFGTASGLNPALDRAPDAFEKSLERTTKTDLAWFFADWVDRDRGLPDLTIEHVNARAQLTSKSAIEGYLVAVEVKNDGDAVADVPVIVRSTEASIKDRLHACCRMLRLRSGCFFAGVRKRWR